MQKASSSVGYIFACSAKTESECLDRMLFASNKIHENKVMQVKTGDLLFLLNVDTKVLYGLFIATSNGTKNIIPEAWKGKYPYQVKVQRLGKTRELRDANRILTRYNIQSHNALDAVKLRILLAIFNNKNSDSWGSLMPDINNIGPNEDLKKGDDKPKLETSTLWDYPRQNYGTSSKGNNKYPGVTPAFVIYNLIRRYTDPGDLVLDPMAGSGTCIDVCNEEGRKCIAYDIVPTRQDIIQNDARRLDLEDNSVDLVFIDSPYGNNIRYNDHERDIGKISAESDMFYEELSKVIRECHRVLKPGKVLAWVIGDQWVKKQFTPVGFNLYSILREHFDTIDIICIVRHKQASNMGKWSNRALIYNFYLRGFKYLFIMKKSLSKTGEKYRHRSVKWKAYSRTNFNGSKG